MTGTYFYTDPLPDLTLKNFVNYAKVSGYPSDEGERLLEDCRKAQENKDLLIFVPFFIVTGVAP